MKLNLMCGQKMMDGFHNVDARNPEAQEVSDVMSVDYVDGTVEEIHIIHGLEYLTEKDAQELLMRCRRWLTESGALVIELPCLEKCVLLIDEKHRTTRHNEKFSTGAHGIIGGRTLDHQTRSKFWEWLTVNEEMIRDKAMSDSPMEIPDRFRVAGEDKQSLYPYGMLCDLLSKCGFNPGEMDDPEHHKARVHRDIRVVSHKLEHSLDDESGTTDVDGPNSYGKSTLPVGEGESIPVDNAKPGFIPGTIEEAEAPQVQGDQEAGFASEGDVKLDEVDGEVDSPGSEQAG